MALDYLRIVAVVITCLPLFGGPAFAQKDGPVAHWTLSGDCEDHSGGDHHAINHGVNFDGPDGAVFNGVDAWIEVPSSEAIRPGKGPFAVAVWIHTEAELDDVLGDVLSWYDPATRTGVNLTLMNYAGVTSGQSNWRNILFGIDAGHVDPEWTDRGRPGNCRYVKSLVVHDGDLYAATWESGQGEVGHVYRYAGGTEWIDCGSPDRSNAVTGLAVYEGKLYAGSEYYSGGGSALPLSPNTEHGGRVFRYEGGTRWTDCGKVADVRSISGLAVYRGGLYAGTGSSGGWRDTPRTRGMYRYEGDDKWTSCGCPGTRIVHLGVHNGSLYGLSYDGGGFFRYGGPTEWTQMGPVPDTSQVYSMAVHQGRIHVGTWPTGSVYRFDGPQKWTHVGQLGQEKEVMGMAVYNGRLYAGTLPLAEVYRYDGGTTWVSTGRLEHTPDVRYRRAWSMAVHDGMLFCGVLPSGRVLSLEAGKSATYDRALTPGWHHLVAVREKDRLGLYIDGTRVAQSTVFDPTAYDLTTEAPLKIGFGQHDYFNGRMKDLRIYNRALGSDEISELGK